MQNKHNLGCIALAAILSASANFADAQAVVFPQQDQPGSAALVASDGVYTLQNDLFSASFLAADGKLIFNGSDALGLKSGSDLFSIILGDNTAVTSSEMTLGEVKTVELTDDPQASVASHHIPGHALEATYSYGDLSFVWRAVLRDGSHYLRTELELSTENEDGVEMTSITPMRYVINSDKVGDVASVGNTRGAILASDKIFAGLESPMGVNSVGVAGSGLDSDFTLTSWNANSFDWKPATVPSDIIAMGYSAAEIAATAGYAKFSQAGNTEVTFLYSGGTHRLNIAGVDVVDLDGNVVASDYHYGYTGNLKADNVYTLNIPEAGIYIIRFFIETQSETITSTGSISYSPDVTAPAASELPASDLEIVGLWERPTTLPAGRTWKISSVVGLMAPGQARRSVLAYSERERAVPWRSFSLYNSWYELNINRNNDADYSSHMTIDDCVRVTNQWKTNLYEKNGANIQAMVWDDGWDSYGTWTFNPNFPNGFTEVDEVAKSMNTGIGAWLGPVGGYGTSGTLRRNYWTDKGGMTLGNPEYYQVFLDACTHMVTSYDFRFFKFDGISSQFSSTGPDSGADGIEKAEGIIQLEQDVRALKPDIFLNTTVGTWASPFWFHYTDAVWRQENDWSTTTASGAQASCNDRERWITYRDRLVYQNFVQNSPLCPINTMMTHGFILTSYGSVSKDMSYRSIVNELRCAYGCGSGMIELYADYALLNKAYTDGKNEEGELWEVIADLIRWHESNADVLPDIHWVGGNPCNQSTGTGEVYGWGAWNGEKVVLTLRNPNGVATAFKGTLREALEIPDYVTDAIILTKPFDDQAELVGLASGEALDIDAEINVMIPANGVYMFNGVHTDEEPVPPMPAVEYVEQDEPEAGDYYPINFEKDLEHTSKYSRTLASVTLSPSSGLATTIAVGNRITYNDLTDYEVPVQAGDVITPTASYSGNYMHAYWYVDWNEDGAFTYGIDDNGLPTGELVSFNYYNGKNSAGTTVASSTGPGANNPTFTVPADTKPGVYRCRFKVDWNNIDAGGQYGLGSNDINDNSGYIIDFLIHVYADKATVSSNAELLTSDNEVVNAEGIEVERQVTLVLKNTTLKGAEIAKLTARSGYHLDNASYKYMGNPTWKEYVISERGNGTYNIPFDLVDRPIVLTAEVLTSDGVREIILDENDYEIYDLRGIRVENPGRGLYIVNGKKSLLR